MERWLGPSMRTCASGLLRTRVKIAVQEQNQALLASMESRVCMQLRLQETVKGLSAGAISYFLQSIVNYMLKATAKMGSPLDPALATGIITPFVMGSIYWGVPRVRKRLTRAQKPPKSALFMKWIPKLAGGHELPIVRENHHL